MSGSTRQQVWAKAEAAGLTVMTVDEASAEADVIMVLMPDTVQAQVYRESIAPHLTAGQDADVRATASTSASARSPAGRRGREHGRAQGARPSRARGVSGGRGVPALIAVYQDASGQARRCPGLCARASAARAPACIETTFDEETETDLFGEQAVLCGGVSALVKAGFETLVEAGYQPEIAYFECLHELKLIVDLMYQGGLSYMRYSVSDTAEHGDYTGGPQDHHRPDRVPR